LDLIERLEQEKGDNYILENFITLLFATSYLDDHIKGISVGGENSTHINR
jgi:hypothetical protein